MFISNTKTKIFPNFSQYSISCFKSPILPVLQGKRTYVGEHQRDFRIGNLRGVFG